MFEVWSVLFFLRQTELRSIRSIIRIRNRRIAFKDPQKAEGESSIALCWNQGMFLSSELDTDAEAMNPEIMLIKHEAFKRYRMKGSPDIDAHRSDDSCRLRTYQLILGLLGKRGPRCERCTFAASFPLPLSWAQCSLLHRKKLLVEYNSADM